jgi:hypothetical protein
LNEIMQGQVTAAEFVSGADLSYECSQEPGGQMVPSARKKSPGGDRGFAIRMGRSDQ